MLFKSEIIWTRTDQVIRLDFLPLNVQYISNDIKLKKQTPIYIYIYIYIYIGVCMYVCVCVCVCDSANSFIADPFFLMFNVFFTLILFDNFLDSKTIISVWIYYVSELYFVITCLL